MDGDTMWISGMADWPVVDVVDRRGARRRTSIGATLLREGQPAATISLQNLSRFGFMAEGDGRIEIGETLALALDGTAHLLVPVLIVWALAGRIGGEFATPLDAGMFQLITGMDSADE